MTSLLIFLGILLNWFVGACAAYGTFQESCPELADRDRLSDSLMAIVLSGLACWIPGVMVGCVYLVCLDDGIRLRWKIPFMV